MESPPLSVDDLFRFRWVDGARLSPEGMRIAYQVGWADPEARANRGHVVVGALDGSGEVVLAGSGRRDRAPAWSPGGERVAFLGRVGAADQIFVAPATAGPAVQLTSFPDGLSALRWSPDGANLAFLAAVPADPEGVVDDPRPPLGDEQTRRPPVVRVARRLDYKHDGGGYGDGRHTHLFVVPAGGGELAQLTDGAWSVEALDWSPDGRHLAVTGDPEPGADLRREPQLHVVGLDGSRRRVAGGRRISCPAWAPGGAEIAFLAPTGPEAGLLERVWTVAAGGGEPRCLTPGLDRSCDGSVINDMRAGGAARLQWNPAGDRVLFLASGPGVAEVCSVDLDGRVRVELSAERRAVYDFDLGPGGLAACVSDPGRPGDVFYRPGDAGGDAGQARRLTEVNPWLSERHVALPERHLFTAPDGWEVEGWLLKPPGFDPAARHPLVMEVHGGPHAQYGWTFFHEFQVLAGLGFLVFYVNPRGSDGYGEVFRRAVVRDWAGRDHQDLMSALDQLIERTGVVDEARMGIGGGSYGGYMTNWIIGHTDRFAAAVSMRSISNLVSEYSQHDIVPWGALELGPPPWPDPDELWRRSPIRYVREMRTPLLLVHGEMDLRCAISQAEELFGALRLLGREVEMARFPGESHDLSRNGRPDRRAERLRRVTGWFEKFLLARPAAGISEAPAAN